MTEAVQRKQLSLDTLQEDLGLRYQAIFVPFSQSRHAVPKPQLKDLQVNWKVRLKRGSVSLDSDYSEGIGCLPGYKCSAQVTMREYERIHLIVESGEYGRLGYGGPPLPAPLPAPKLEDVLYCLVLDARVIDYAAFEEWARDIGYDTDSRAAEKIYQECLKQGLRLRAMFGDQLLRELQELFQDY